MANCRQPSTSLVPTSTPIWSGKVVPACTRWDAMFSGHLWKDAGSGHSPITQDSWRLPLIFSSLMPWTLQQQEKAGLYHPCSQQILISGFRFSSTGWIHVLWQVGEIRGQQHPGEDSSWRQSPDVHLGQEKARASNSSPGRIRVLQS